MPKKKNAVFRAAVSVVARYAAVKTAVCEMIVEIGENTGLPPAVAGRTVCYDTRFIRPVAGRRS